MLEVTNELVVYGVAAVYVAGCVGAGAAMDFKIRRLRREITFLKTKTADYAIANSRLSHAACSRDAILYRHLKSNNFLDRELDKTLKTHQTLQQRAHKAIKRANTNSPNATVRKMVLILLGEG